MRLRLVRQSGTSTRGVPTQLSYRLDSLGTWLQVPTIELGAPIEVAGESFYQPALLDTCGGAAGQGARWRLFTAHLVREPDNPHDSNAVRVDISGRTVGHVPREDAQRFHRVLARLATAGRPATARAELTGGWIENHTPMTVGVRLHTGRRPAVWSGREPFLPSRPWHELVPVSLSENPAGTQGTVTLADAGRGALAVQLGDRWIGHLLDRPDLVDLVTRTVTAGVPPTAALVLEDDVTCVRLVNPDAVAPEMAALPPSDLRSLRRAVRPTGRWNCVRCGRIWLDPRPVSPRWFDDEGEMGDWEPHVCRGCGSYAFTHPW